MTDDNASGNRWEPDQTAADPTAPIQATEQAAGPSPAAGRPGLRERARNLRGSRTALAGGAVAVLLAVGASGFAAGWAASPDDQDPAWSGPDGHRGLPEGIDGDGDGHFPDGSQPDGTQPDDGGSEDQSFSQSSWYVVPSGSSDATV